MDYDKTSKAERIPLKRENKPADIFDLLIFKERYKKTFIEKVLRR
jgi:hypothetical protein